MRFNYLTSIVGLAMLLSITGCTTSRENTVKSGTDIYREADDFLDALSRRVKERSGSERVPDIIVTPTAFGEWPIGTLLYPGSTLPVDATACVPNGDSIRSVPLPSAFPSYKGTLSGAIQVGLSNDLVQGLADAGLDVRNSRDVEITIAGPKLQIIDETTFRSVLTSTECKELLANRELWFVRGHVLATRSISFERSSNYGAKADIQSILGFNINQSGKSRLEVVDSAPSSFVNLISTVKVDNQSAQFSRPATPTGKGRIFIQKDRSDRTGLGTAVFQTLSQADFSVVPQIESIESSRMPRSAQVRYFHASDEDLAKRVATTITPSVGQITPVKVNLPAPAGQLEVWLPRRQ